MPAKPWRGHRRPRLRAGHGIADHFRHTHPPAESAQTPFTGTVECNHVPWHDLRRRKKSDTHLRRQNSACHLPLYPAVAGFTTQCHPPCMRVSLL
jgi:hypothetical protein